jgi:two-component system, OmpR family, sensor histidine kinase BaeS
VRLTITRKIAMAMVGTVIVCIGTMTWLTSKNLQRGFVDYLNEMQLHQLDELRDLLVKRYRQHGSFQWLDQNPQALHELFDRLRSGTDHAPRPESGSWQPEHEPEAPIDPMGIGRRLSMVDGSGNPVFGQPDPKPGIRRAIVVDGTTVGILMLAPLKQIATDSASGFVYGQIRDMLWLACALIGFSALLAWWLARQLLQPVAILRNVAQHISAGRLGTRAKVCGRDELGELAQHVNTMAHTLDVNQQQRRRMLADVAHELRTPLTVIRGEIEALLDGIRHADPMALKSLHVEALHLNKLINDLHQLALADSGDLQYQRCQIDLSDLVRSVAQRHCSRISVAGLALECEVPEHAIAISADAGRLTQLLSNLLENSIRYTDAGGRVLVTLIAVDDHAELAVEDSAPGVPFGTHTRLFERLYRVDLARNRGRGGSGLGLPICKALVEAHGGTIAAMASFLGGVKIVVRLPLLPTPENVP